MRLLTVKPNLLRVIHNKKDRSDGLKKIGCVHVIVLCLLYSLREKNPSQYLPRQHLILVIIYILKSIFIFFNRTKPLFAIKGSDIL